MPTKENRLKHLILGGGASALSTAVLIPDATIIELTHKVGGLSNSRSIDGFTFDQGPHIMFSRNKEVLQIMIDSLLGNIHTCKRNNVVMINGSLLRYPIENDLSSLPIDVRVSAIQDFLAKKIEASETKPKNLEEWFIQNFGETLTELYFKPYNEKIWNLPFSQISMTWAERIPSPPWQDVLQGSFGIQTEGYLHQLYYQYPKFGGYESLMKSWASKISSDRIRTSSEVKKINKLSNQKFELQVNNTVEHFEGRIISTIPLRTLCSVYEKTPPRIKELVDGLPVNPLITVNLGFEKRDTNQFTAIYIPDEDFLVNRLSFPGVFSPENVPSENHMLIQAEITVKESSEIWLSSDDFLIDHVLEGLIRRGVIERSDKPVFQFVDRIKDAYVVYPTEFESKRFEIQEYFASQDIYINGRFGSHNYLNVDGILMQSIELAQMFESNLGMEEIRNRFGL